ncbi:reverse transcriptase family protein [Burkholderia stagnalis]|uniref:reverse transcriptase family protein n=1 Tax=Burkholderia stagnalis TaxID=1503054 RepID=UPI0009BD8B4B|nr:reverse transcriptase family protein [Burkholderia stagnalis]
MAAILNPIKVATGSISSIDNLCAALDITRAELDAALELDILTRYQRDETPKKDGSMRVVYKPDYRIRRIQRRINRRIFSRADVILWPDHLFGSIPNQESDDGDEIQKDYVACARLHCEAKSIVSIDIQNFFDNIHSDLVLDIFEKFLQYPSDVARTLTDICCRGDHIVQGALTSSYIASLCLYDIEGKTVERLSKKGLTYTRLVDDITVSSKIANYKFDYAMSVIEDMLTSKDLPINTSKTKIQYVSTTGLLVHGLRVSFQQPRLPSDEVRRIRAAVQNIETLAAEKGYRQTHAYRQDFNRCMGRVNKLSRVEHNQHANFLRRLQKILPLPSKKDINRATKIIENLERDFEKKSGTYWYAKRFYLAHERLNVLNRSFPAITKRLRARLKPLKQNYE